MTRVATLQNSFSYKWTCYLQIYIYIYMYTVYIYINWVRIDVIATVPLVKPHKQASCAELKCFRKVGKLWAERMYVLRIQKGGWKVASHELAMTWISRSSETLNPKPLVLQLQPSIPPRLITQRDLEMHQMGFPKIRGTVLFRVLY